MQLRKIQVVNVKSLSTITLKVPDVLQRVALNHIVERKVKRRKKERTKPVRIVTLQPVPSRRYKEKAKIHINAASDQKCRMQIFVDILHMSLRIMYACLV